MRNFLRANSLWIAIAVGIGLLFGLSHLIAYLLGPVTCRDGWASSSIGRRGACSWHGGVDRSRDGLIFFVFLISGAAGWFTFAKLNEEPPLPAIDPATWKLCPKCRSKMHHHPEHQNFLLCDRHPQCEGFYDLRKHPPAGSIRPSDPFPQPKALPAPNPPPPALPPLVRPAIDDGKSCPDCGSRMVLRKAKRGPNRGKRFYGCTNYPRCTGTRPHQNARR